MRRAFVCGCRGLVLGDDERGFLRESEPFGVILFKRNVESPAQLCALIRNIRECLGRNDAEVLVDQEGGRVQRLGPPHWRAYPAAARLAGTDLPFARKGTLIRNVSRLIARDLRETGISIDCAPVLDVRVSGAHDVIGNRAYGGDPQTVAALGRSAALGLLDEGILPVMKHAPGHGRAMVDSHKALPIVSAGLAELEETDFRPFAANADLPAAMTAHVVYKSLDEAPATLSSSIVADIIRKKIGFSGLLFSDDLSMQALSGGLGERAAAAFTAGVDIALHCNGDLVEAEAVAAASPVLAGESLARAESASLRRTSAMAEADSSFDPVEAWAEIAAALAIAA
ncbi:MAG: beta-N-acetylhexosaminidase [Beijerinckiaceae bacterium]|nr:MAG: beta-N-acetylhexosaminidase [Beijerinckiaceae bacterium]